MRKTAFIILLIGIHFCLFSQEIPEGHVQIIQDARIDTLLSKYIYKNEQNPGIEGWRVEIFFEAGNYSKQQARDAQSNFVKNHPDVPVYLIFQEPYYKVRVGDFRTKMEAEKLLREIEREYPNAFVVSDEINFPKLDKVEKNNR